MAAEAVHEERDRGFEVMVVATPHPGEACVRLRGELDIATVPVARNRLTELRRAGRDVIIDLRELSFMDSSGVHLMLEVAAESTRNGWSVSLIPGQRVVQRIFQLTGTAERLPFRSPTGNGKRLQPAH